MAVACVGLEVGALGPFVPRVEEDHVLGRGPLRGHFDELPEPVGESLGRGALEDPRALLVARGVVPVDERAGKGRDAAFALDLEHLLPDHVVVVEGEAGEEAVAQRAQHVLHLLGQPAQRRHHLARLQHGALEIRRVNRLERLELDGRVEMPQHFGHREFVLLHRHEIEAGKPALVRALAPEVEHPVDLVDAMGAIDEEHRLAVDLDRAIVAPCAEQVVEVPFPQRRVGPMRLFLQDVVIPPVPSTRPRLVGPRETEWKVEFLRARARCRWASRGAACRRTSSGNDRSLRGRTSGRYRSAIRWSACRTGRSSYRQAGPAAGNARETAASPGARSPSR